MRNDFGSDYLMHHGILGQKWGVRRYQNDDGSLTDAGKKRYAAESSGKIDTVIGTKRRLNDVDQAIAFNKKDMRKSQKTMDKLEAKSKAQAFKITQKMKQGKSLKVIAKENAKLKKMAEDYKAAKDKNAKAKEYIKQGESETWKLIGKATENGMSVTGSQSMRLTMNKGEAAITALFAANGGALGGVVVGTMITTGERSQVGYRYKVKGDGQGKVQIKKKDKLEVYDKR